MFLIMFKKVALDINMALILALGIDRLLVLREPMWLVYNERLQDQNMFQVQSGFRSPLSSLYVHDSACLRRVE